jgi:hypothetical protein
MTRTSRLGLALGTLWLLPACAGDGPAVGGGSQYDQIQRTIFNVSCVSGACHNSANQAGGLVLEDGVSYNNLVGVPPVNAAAKAAGLLRVTPTEPDQSFLLVKLTGPTAPEGSRMPLGGESLSTDQIDQVRSWILAGAPPPADPAPSRTPTPATLTAAPTPTATPTPPANATPTYSLASTFPDIQATIFDTTCSDAGCHAAGSQAGGLSLAGTDAYGNLVNAAASNPAAADAGHPRVDPGLPEHSFLMTKLLLPGSFDPTFGSRMPLGKAPLSSEQIEAIRAWILRGALIDERP